MNDDADGIAAAQAIGAIVGLLVGSLLVVLIENWSAIASVLFRS